jgi:hypothetical protein
VFGGDRLAEPGRVEARMDHRPRPREQGRLEAREAVLVGERQRVDEHIVVAPARGVRKLVCGSLQRSAR